MIVRIATEGQYRLEEAAASRLDELDDAVVAAVERGDHGAFAEAFSRLLDAVRAGDPLPVDELAASDVILPPPDTRFDEASREFSGEGLLPDVD